MGDYTSQALVSALVKQHFPRDEIVGEEESTELRKEANKAMKDRIVQLANDAMQESLASTKDEQLWEPVKRQQRTEDDWLKLIDQGNSSGGPSGSAYHVALAVL